MRIREVLFRLIGARDPNCPNETDVLAYYEGRLSTRPRAQIERHFAECHDCRQILAFLVRESDQAPVRLAGEAVSEQTDRVLAYMREDDRKKPAEKTRVGGGFYISYPKLAAVGLFICAIAITGVFLFTRTPEPAGAAMAALRLGLRDARFSEGRISGGFDYSRYAGTMRGAGRNADDLHLDRAENKLTATAQETTAAESRLVLARVCLARGNREAAKRALSILDQLTKSGMETAETLNDTGVAYLQLDNSPEAITYFSKALAKSPVYTEALFNLALAEERARRNEDARRDWQAFIEKSPDDNWKIEAREHLNRLSDTIR